MTNKAICKVFYKGRQVGSLYSDSDFNITYKGKPIATATAASSDITLKVKKKLLQDGIKVNDAELLTLKKLMSDNVILKFGSSPWYDITAILAVPISEIAQMSARSGDQALKIFGRTEVPTDEIAQMSTRSGDRASRIFGRAEVPTDEVAQMSARSGDRAPRIFGRAEVPIGTLAQVCEAIETNVISGKIKFFVSTKPSVRKASVSARISAILRMSLVPIYGSIIKAQATAILNETLSVEDITVGALVIMALGNRIRATEFLKQISGAKTIIKAQATAILTGTVSIEDITADTLAIMTSGTRIQATESLKQISGAKAITGAIATQVLTGTEKLELIGAYQSLSVAIETYELSITNVVEQITSKVNASKANALYEAHIGEVIKELLSNSSPDVTTQISKARVTESLSLIHSVLTGIQKTIEVIAIRVFESLTPISIFGSVVSASQTQTSTISQVVERITNRANASKTSAMYKAHIGELIPGVKSLLTGIQKTIVGIAVRAFEPLMSISIFGSVVSTSQTAKVSATESLLSINSLLTGIQKTIARIVVQAFEHLMPVSVFGSVVFASQTQTSTISQVVEQITSKVNASKANALYEAHIGEVIKELLSNGFLDITTKVSKVSATESLLSFLVFGGAAFASQTAKAGIYEQSRLLSVFGCVVSAIATMKGRIEEKIQSIDTGARARVAIQVIKASIYDVINQVTDIASPRLAVVVKRLTVSSRVKIGEGIVRPRTTNQTQTPTISQFEIMSELLTPAVGLVIWYDPIRRADTNLLIRSVYRVEVRGDNLKLY